ncbi:hypothetical protein MLD38_024891 [Melastoma candidum]|uniref:Uncharacterized protein n=1 Tax=Melastoma candidum TaxID=119954 RepID=A0ACB9NU37_9MYRT|nr:hypothetical protein MLD38_024891 [Melastoma candidum]
MVFRAFVCGCPGDTGFFLDLSKNPYLFGSNIKSLHWRIVKNGALAEKKVADATAKLEHVRRSESEALAEIKI